MKVKLTASTAFGYGGVRLVAGQEFEANRTDARTLVAIGKARLYEAAAEEAIDEPVQDEPSNPKRGYNRRDMKAK